MADDKSTRGKRLLKKIGKQTLTKREIETINEFLRRELGNREQIERWKPEAVRLGVALDELNRAASLLDANGKVAVGFHYWEFRYLMERAILTIHHALLRERFKPMVDRDISRQAGCPVGGKNSSRTRVWAREAAQMLHDRYPNTSAAFMWERIPIRDEFSSSEFTTKSLWTLYRDEVDEKIKLFAENDDGPGVSFSAFRGYVYEIRRK